MKNRFSPILPLLLLIALLLSSCGITPLDPPTDGTTATATVPATTAPSGEDPTDPFAEVGDPVARLLATGKVTVGREDVTFTLTQADIDALNAKIDELERLLAEGTDYPAFDELYVEASEDDLDAIATQDQIIYVLWCCDVTDPLTEAAYLAADAAYTALVGRFYRMYETIWQSPFRDDFYGDWTLDEIAEARRYAAGYTPEYEALEEANNNILVEYRALSDQSPDYGIESARLFLEMAKNNDAQAKLLGFPGYMEYAYSDIYGRDYTPEETAPFRKAVGDCVVPLLAALNGSFQTDLFSLSSAEYQALLSLLYGDITEGFSSVLSSYASAVGEGEGSFREAYDELYSEKNYYVCSDEDLSYEGAFTGYYASFGFPVLYFGPGYHAPLTFLHEFGHYYSALNSEGEGMYDSYDLAESQSQGDEFLFPCWLGSWNAAYANVARILAEYQLVDACATILQCSLVNDFEVYVYSHLDTLTPEDLDGVLISVCDAYGGYETVKEGLGYAPELYWHYVVLESPGYYISYAVSVVPAIELYVSACRDGFANAVESYLSITHADAALGFGAALEEAGLGSPFDPATFSSIVDFYVDLFSLDVKDGGQ